MSARRMRRDRDRRARREARRAAELAKKTARAQGCTCAVEAAVTWRWPDFPLVRLRHDDHCPLLRVRQEGAGRDAPQVVLAPREPRFKGPGR